MDIIEDPRYVQPGTYRLKTWYLLKDEERSQLLYQAYRHKVLTSEEIKPFLDYVRLSNITQLIWPAIAYPILNATLFKHNIFRYKLSKEMSPAVKISAVAFSWVGWLNYNPFYLKSFWMKEDLLQTVDNRIGMTMLQFNEILPRTRTCAEIHRRIRQ